MKLNRVSYFHTQTTVALNKAAHLVRGFGEEEYRCYLFGKLYIMSLLKGKGCLCLDYSVWVLRYVFFFFFFRMRHVSPLSF